MRPLTILAAVLFVAGLAGVWWLTNNTGSPTAGESTTVDTLDTNDTEQSTDTKPVPDPVAVVNGEAISSNDFAALEAQIATPPAPTAENPNPTGQTVPQEQVLDSLIAQTLLQQAVAEAAITVSDDAVAAQLDQVRGQFPDAEAFNQALNEQGVTEADLTAQVTADLQTEQYLEQTLDLAALTVDESEIESTYEQLAAQQGDVPPLAEVRTELEQFALQQKRQTRIEQHLAELQETAEIEIFM